jgi:hypothetical protein
LFFEEQKWFCLLKEQASAEKLACSSSLVPVFAIEVVVVAVAAQLLLGLCGLGWKIARGCFLRLEKLL